MPEPAPDLDPAALNALYRVARALLEERDYGQLLAALLDTTIEALHAERGFILLPDGDRFRATVARNFRSESLAEAEQEVSNSIARSVLEQGEALLVSDALATQAFGQQQSVKRLRLRSVLCAPVLCANEVIALVYLENRSAADFFTEAHRKLLDEICALAAPRLKAALIAEDTRKRAEQIDPLLDDADGIVTADPAVVAVLRTVRQVAPTDLPVLIQGETGTGKELIARALYRSSNRSRGAFVVLNCAAVPASLIASELFGHVRGAFTGAVGDRVGFIGAAHRGTLFLDEIGDLPADLQPNLLRVLQSGEFTRVGSVQPETADLRFIAATNRDLQREVEEARFRSDLFYRLSAVTLKLPPLRERPHDIYLLAPYFLRRYAVRYGREAPTLDLPALVALSNYSFPGNIRELESEMARLVAVSPPGATLGPEALNERMRAQTADATTKDARDPQRLPPMPLADMERRLITSVLEHTGGNRTRAADLLGISREGLRTKMQRLGLAQDES